MPEARFPDEKFWSKDGDPIQAAPKGAPQGTKGSTFKDYGSSRELRRATDTATPQKRNWQAIGKALRDRFSSDSESFRRNIEAESAKLFGPQWKNLIDRAWGSKGFADNAIEKMWNKNYSDNEAMQEIGFLFDLAQRPGELQGYTPDGSPWEPNDKFDFDSDWNETPRPGRPTGVGGDGKLTYQ